MFKRNPTVKLAQATGKHLSHAIPIQNGLKGGDALTPLIFKFALDYIIGSSDKIKRKLN
jgi:hypothetical protein